MNRPPLHHLTIHLLLIAVCTATALSGGCANSLDHNLLAATDVGRYGGARVAIQKQVTANKGDRNYILDRLRLLILTLADGQPDAAEVTANQTFSLLSTQGVNADRTVSAVVINENVKIWKGEPFEQALGYHYIAMQKAERGEWDNARASSSSSLFLLKDFSDRGGAKHSLTTTELAERAAAQDARHPGGGDRYLDKGYVAVKTDFALGYLVNGISNLALGRTDEANDNFNEALQLNPGLANVCDQLRSGKCNTIFVVDYGPGPAKVTYGPDGAMARFEPRQHSDARGLEIGVVGGLRDVYLPACDVNQMAQNHMWNNLEDVRTAKSIIGSALLIGGTAAAASTDNNKTRTVGLIAAGIGLLMKSTAVADTRYCEFLPQRVYVAPVFIPSPGATVTIAPVGDDRARIVLTDVAPPRDPDRMQLRYVRLNHEGPQPWATSGQTYYANERSIGPVDGETLPYILGGRCVRTPTEAVMQEYRSAGNLTDLTASELQNLYREDGVALTVEDQHGGSRKHILEGGDSLVCPLSGTTGYQRLFGQIHPPYAPRSPAMKDYAQQHAPPPQR